MTDYGKELNFGSEHTATADGDHAAVTEALLHRAGFAPDPVDPAVFLQGLGFDVPPSDAFTLRVPIDGIEVDGVEL